MLPSLLLAQFILRCRSELNISKEFGIISVMLLAQKGSSTILVQGVSTQSDTLWSPRWATKNWSESFFLNGSSTFEFYQSFFKKVILAGLGNHWTQGSGWLIRTQLWFSWPQIPMQPHWPQQPQKPQWPRWPQKPFSLKKLPDFDDFIPAGT